MVGVFEKYLEEYSLDKAEIARICSLARQRSLRRNESLLAEGEVCRYKVFICSGLLRTYRVSADGAEHSLQFSPEATWTLEVESYDKQIPSQYNISAIEASEVLLWTKHDFETLLAELPKLKELSQKVISNNIYNSRHRLATALSATPEEKYSDFVRTSPQLLARLPLHMIASYLGMSLKTLTRIRHAQWAR